MARTMALTLLIELAVILRAWPALLLLLPLLKRGILFQYLAMLLRIELRQSLLCDLADVRVLVDHGECSFSQLVSCLTNLIQKEV